MTDPGTPATDAVSLVNAMTGFVAESGRYNRPIPPSHHTPNLHPADPLMMAANQYPAPFAPLGHLPLSFHPAASNFHPHAYANPHAVHPAAYHQMQTYGQYIPPFAYPPAAVWPDHHRQGYPPYMNSAPPQMPPPGFPPGGIPHGAPPHVVPLHQLQPQQPIPPGFAVGTGPTQLVDPRTAVCAFAGVNPNLPPPFLVDGKVVYGDQDRTGEGREVHQRVADVVTGAVHDEDLADSTEDNTVSGEDSTENPENIDSETSLEPVSSPTNSRPSQTDEETEEEEEEHLDPQDDQASTLLQRLQDLPEPTRGGGGCSSKAKTQVENSGSEKLASAPTASRTITRSQDTAKKTDNPSKLNVKGESKDLKLAGPSRLKKADGKGLKAPIKTTVDKSAALGTKKKTVEAVAKLALEKVAAVNAASVKDGDGGVASQLPEKRGPGRRPKVNQRSRPRTANNQRITSNAEFTARKAAEAAAEAAKEKKADNKDKTDYDCSSASRSTGLYDKKESKKVDEVVQKVGDKLAKTNKK